VRERGFVVRAALTVARGWRPVLSGVVSHSTICGDDAARERALREARRLFAQIGATGWVRRLDETQLSAGRL
jgi:hypothetical protein